MPKKIDYTQLRDTEGRSPGASFYAAEGNRDPFSWRTYEIRQGYEKRAAEFLKAFTPAILEAAKQAATEPDSSRCKCGKRSQASHTCPYREEVNKDSTTKCNCCTTCTSRCLEDV